MTDIRETSLGLWLVAIGSGISLVGVCYNNILLDHTAAMHVWRWSNIIFVIYFLGRWRKWWDGGISDFMMMSLYGFFMISNEIGLSESGL